MASYDPHTEELIYQSGDAPDPEGQIGGGFQQSINLGKSASGHPKIRYRDIVIEADVYDLEGVAFHVMILCPRCRNSLRISRERKAIDWDPEAGHPQDGGQISIEPFQCTWENGERNGERQDFGLGLCGWRVAVDKNIARDV